MKLTLVRTNLDSQCTEGEMLVDGQQEFYTLELPVKGGLPGSAIPPGTYPVELLPSPKFELSADPWVMKYAAQIPRLKNIPGRSNILIHWGNLVADTDGCILVGLERGTDFISHSRSAFERLWSYLRAAADAGEPVTIEVQGGIPVLNNHDDVQTAAEGT